MHFFTPDQLLLRILNEGGRDGQDIQHVWTSEKYIQKVGSEA